MTCTELTKFDGKNGNAAYVAVAGIIYDVSASPLWKEGVHEDIHHAGTDLTEALAHAPHVKAVLEKFPVVGNWRSLKRKNR